MPSYLPPELRKPKLAGEGRLDSALRALTLTHELSRKVFGEAGLEALLQEVIYVPVVIFSSLELEEDQAQARMLGANEFARKPGSGLGFDDIVRKLKQERLISCN